MIAIGLICGLDCANINGLEFMEVNLFLASKFLVKLVIFCIQSCMYLASLALKFKGFKQGIKILTNLARTAAR